MLGAGSWGTALALLLGRNGREVVLYGRDPDAVESLRQRRENLQYLPGFVLPECVSYERMEGELPPGEMSVVAVPSMAVAGVLPLLGEQSLVLVASKGLDPSGDRLLSDAVEQTHPGTVVAVLSGPNLAVEIARGVPTLAVVACSDEPSAEKVRAAFMSHTYRVYLSDDVRGVELAGALKNVLAIGAGMSDGLGYGDNTKGALLARGLNEVAGIGLAMGARLDTFLGIAGVGDLFATASSTLSRNYRVGRALGAGRSLRDVLEEIGQVAEGVTSCEVAVRIARRMGVPAPICEAIDAVLHGRIEARKAVPELMERTPRKEGVFPGVAQP